jgi:hypothetical protein
MRFCPEGAVDISRWRQPPEPHPHNGLALKGRQTNLSPQPLPGLNGLFNSFRWLAPPANIHSPFGAKGRFRDLLTVPQFFSVTFFLRYAERLLPLEVCEVWGIESRK